MGLKYNKKAQARVLKKVKHLKNPKVYFDDDFKKVDLQGLRNLASETPFKTGDTRRAWKPPKKISDSHWIVVNDKKTPKKKIPLVMLLNDGHALVNGGRVRGKKFIEKVDKKMTDLLVRKMIARIKRV